VSVFVDVSADAASVTDAAWDRARVVGVLRVGVAVNGNRRITAVYRGIPQCRHGINSAASKQLGYYVMQNREAS